MKTYRSWQAVIDHNLHHFDTFGPGVPPVGAHDVNLHFHPIQWASGFQTLYPYYVRGARTVLLDDEVFHPGVLLDTIASEQVTGVFMPGPLLTPVLDEIETRGGFTHRLRRMVVFFGNPDQLDRTTRLLGPVWAHGFGSTEQGAITTRLLPYEVEERRERIKSVGRSGSPFLEVAVVDEQGARLGPGQVGEIVVRSAMSLGEYWALPERNAQSFFPGDWFRPYDVGFLDEDGFLYYSDRAGDRITTARGTVYPHLVEEAILGHASVFLCGVVGLGEPGGEQVVVGVQLKEGVTASDQRRPCSRQPGWPALLLTPPMPPTLRPARWFTTTTARCRPREPWKPARYNPTRPTCSTRGWPPKAGSWPCPSRTRTGPPACLSTPSCTRAATGTRAAAGGRSPRPACESGPRPATAPLGRTVRAQRHGRRRLGRPRRLVRPRGPGQAR